MSFAIAISVNGVGVIMADTRLNLQHMDGRCTVDDNKKFSLVYDDEITLKWTNRFRKIIQANNFIIASTGNATLGRIVLDQVQEVKPSCIGQIQEIIKTKNKEVDSLLCKVFPLYKGKDLKSAFITVEYHEGETRLNKMDHTGSIIHSDINYVISFPPDIYNDEVSKLTEYFESKCSGINNLDDFHSTISLMAELSNMVYMQSSTVSQFVEAVIFTSAPNDIFQANYLSGVASEIARTSIHTLDTLKA